VAAKPAPTLNLVKNTQEDISRKLPLKTTRNKVATQVTSRLFSAASTPKKAVVKHKVKREIQMFDMIENIDYLKFSKKYADVLSKNFASNQT